MTAANFPALDVLYGQHIVAGCEGSGKWHDFDLESEPIWNRSLDMF